MAFFKKEQKPKEAFNKGKNQKDKGGKNLLPTPNFWGSIMGTIIIFLVLSSLYSFVVENRSKNEALPISQLVSDINEGKVTSIVVKGNDLTVSYKDTEETREAKKESGVGITETLKNYNVGSEKLGMVKIEVKEPSGFGYWFLNLAPFLLPILFIVFFIWFLSRQVKGAGMQAFSFGQSKARIIDPNDLTQKITFKDVAGVKEAKEELLEIVDFLKNPKKFLDIGARIPKGILLMGAPG
ncbi:MAG: hypothetical protein Q7S34_02580, partial [bacterium]|nr:hypothetical protein [bacterium]